MKKNNSVSVIQRINKACAYFPCHKKLQDCTFCYCLFYPCLNKKLGKFIYSKKTRQPIWSCRNCSWIHNVKIVDRILDAARFGGVNPKKSVRCSNDNEVGVIILGHGSRIKRANDALNNVIKEIKASGGPKIIEPSYLQLHSPDLHTTVKKIAAKGCKKIIIVPFFLFMGNHVLRDVPKEIRQVKKEYKHIKFIYARNIGQDKRISDITLDRINEALL